MKNRMVNLQAALTRVAGLAGHAQSAVAGHDARSAARNFRFQVSAFQLFRPTINS
jgi:predicted ribonuclease toxin of YeeF-YezG toxin-antitoxin module